MASRRLEHGTLTGQKCPHCPVTVQRPYKPGEDGGLEAHVRVVHPVEYRAWVAVGRPEAGQ